MRHFKQKGFTLIELVVVIAILGILAAFAIPRFIDLNSDARASAVRGLSGSLRSAAALVHGMAMARNATTQVTMEGVTITIANGYPTADLAGIGNALANFEGFDMAGARPNATFTPKGYVDTAGSCTVTYTEATATQPATVTLPDPLDCS